MRETYLQQPPSKGLKFLYHTKLGGLVLRIVTQPWISRLVGKHLDHKSSRRRIQPYVKKHNIDLSQFIAEDYSSFNAFFTRKIRPELRPFDTDATAFVSPCDGKVTAFPITQEATFEVKGFPYTVSTLLHDTELAKRYEGGTCLVLRLTVTDYHRYFYLDDGEKEENIKIKGRLHTVQPVALERRRVFTENSREYTVLHTAHFGDVVEVEVGALMVGRIVNHQSKGTFSRGEEKGLFEFGGSTVILLLERDKVVLDEEFFENTRKGLETVVRCGEKIGTAPNA